MPKVPHRCRARRLSVRLARRKAFPFARQPYSLIASVVVGVVLGSVAAVAARAFEVSRLALPVLDKTKTLAIARAYLVSLLSCPQAARSP